MILINIDHAQIPTFWPINLLCHQRFQKALGQFCYLFIGHFDRKKLVDDLLKRSTIFPNDSRQVKQMLCFHVFDKFWQVVTLSRICVCFPRQRKLLEMTQIGTFFSSLFFWNLDLNFRFNFELSVLLDILICDFEPNLFFYLRGQIHCTVQWLRNLGLSLVLINDHTEWKVVN